MSKFLLLGVQYTDSFLSAPAAKAVEYQRVKFNATMGEGSPYVGFGPEVDKAWHAISYDSECSSRQGNRETNSW